jgi:hypothetical protein
LLFGHSQSLDSSACKRQLAKHPHNAQNHHKRVDHIGVGKAGRPHQQSFETCLSISANLVKPLFRRFSA